MFGPDKKIWELDKGSATAGDVLGRSYMQRFYEGAVLHDRRKGPSGARGQDSAWVNGREVGRCEIKFVNLMLNRVCFQKKMSPRSMVVAEDIRYKYVFCHVVIQGICIVWHDVPTLMLQLFRYFGVLVWRAVVWCSRDVRHLLVH